MTTISPPSNSFLALYARWSLHINTLALALSLLSKIIERVMERKKKEAWLHITSWQRRTALVYHWPPTVGVSISICSMTAHTHHVHRGQTSNSTQSRLHRAQRQCHNLEREFSLHLTLSHRSHTSVTVALDVDVRGSYWCSPTLFPPTFPRGWLSRQ